jgi:hypothetical protein
VAAEFVSLADRLTGIAPFARTPEIGCNVENPPRAPSPSDTSDASGVPVLDARLSAVSASNRSTNDVESPELDAGVAEALRDARLFRARLADAFADTSQRLLRELACEVLARELRLAPCDLSALARRVSERVPVVRVRVAASDLGAVTGMPVLADPALRAGDAIVELAGGALDARLGVRLAAVLEAFA